MNTTVAYIPPMTRANPTADVFAGVAHMLAETLRIEPPLYRAWAMPAERARMPLGSYLLGHGYIRPNQLVHVLTIQQQTSLRGVPQMLGDIMVAESLISPHVLATLLAVQLMDRLVDPTPFQPKRLGEHLVARGLVKPRKLASVLQLQSWLRVQGHAVPLGSLFVQQNLVQRSHIEEIVAQTSAHACA
ncbi:MAG: hypothetical protein EI684_01790 [Candidatus Viridilinea halotolerans]|uniref:Uncharacterized protein n=1 Tax=Candidatus Viridilinea halotolerans TaxID=2491704 RepID=A0A426U9Z3_9CHLR|nr:MAG: hypothetical protein EI684_01790 [Candidatus Viridilinea halotolerans]